MSDPFNAFDMEDLGKRIAQKLVASEPTALGEMPQFNGAGVYAIYYNGATVPCYQMLLTASARALKSSTAQSLVRYPND